MSKELVLAKFKKDQRVVAECPMGGGPGVIINWEVSYVVQLDSGLLFRVLERNIKPEES